MFYERKMKYLEYRVDGEKVRGVGFVKMNARDKHCGIQIHINGLPSDALADGASVEVMLRGGIKGEDGRKLADAGQVGREVRLASLMISGGKADFQLENMSVANMLGTGLHYQEIVALRIPLTSRAEIYSVLGEEKMQEKMEDMMPNEELGKLSEKTPDTGEELHAEESSCGENQKSDNSVAEARMPVCETSGVALQDSKWKQLWAIYPHIRPFQDEREYLSLGPNDFVILAERYYRLIQNSFLLHGYYNYNHLILQRIEQRGEPKYYIGVPGNFYDREKQVAVMFGFESFECFEEPAGQGDYGYYMIQVEL